MPEENHEHVAPAAKASPDPLPATAAQNLDQPTPNSIGEGPKATRHGQDFWEPLIKEWRRSDLTQEVFCRQKSVSLIAFQRWVQRLRARERRAGEGGNEAVSSAGEPASPFVPVAVKGESARGSESPAPLELVLSGGRRVLRIRAAVPEVLLLLVIRAAEADVDEC